MSCGYCALLVTSHTRENVGTCRNVHCVMKFTCFDLHSSDRGSVHSPTGFTPCEERNRIF